jgi:hypothetical protein
MFKVLGPVLVFRFLWPGVSCHLTLQASQVIVDTTTCD